MTWLDYLQWPALVVTVIASWLVSLTQKGKRNTGFWLFLLSNILWVAWGIYAQAYALILLQVCLAVSNIHGVIKNRKEISARALKNMPLSRATG